MSHDYGGVDLLASRPPTGGPWAVVIDADDLAEKAMAVTVELNLSVTTLVTGPTIPGTDLRLRSLTPTGDEVARRGLQLTGRPMVLAERGRAGPSRAVRALGGRELPMRIDSSDGVTAIGLGQGSRGPHDVPGQLRARYRRASHVEMAALPCGW